jgi:hypothetical protein
MSPSREQPAKIFGIGLSKTGTTSLSEALRVLGFKVAHYPRLDRIHQTLRRVDAATDISIAYSYKELDIQYPNSKFILTTRDIESWLGSIKRHFSRPSFEDNWADLLHSSLYGSAGWNGMLFKQNFELHIERVSRHFEERTSDFLILNICAGEGWPQLCQFLNRPIPEMSFPHLHKYCGNRSRIAVGTSA